MILVVGLGNPGGEYARNRHNIGFMAADELVRRHSFGPWRAKHHGLLADGEMGRGERVAPTELDDLALEWLAAGPVEAAVHDALLARFERCRGAGGR